MSKIDTINKALRICQLNTIGSIDDNTEEARVVKVFYDSCISEVIEDYSWSFLVKEVQLNRTETGGQRATREYFYSFELPSDFYRMKNVFATSGYYPINPTVLVGDIGYNAIYYTIRNTKLLANLQDITIVYYNENISESDLQNYPMKFKNLITEKLAFYIARALAPDLESNLDQKYERSLYNMKNFDNQLGKRHGFDNRKSYYIELIPN